MLPYIVVSHQSALTIYPDRGGIVTSLQFFGRELLYQGMLDTTLNDFSKSVKGGIPILFPNAGPLTPEEKEKSGYTLPQHGFARNTPWKITESSQNSLIQAFLSSDVVDMYGFPWIGIMKNQIILSDNSCEFSYQISNDGDMDLPISWGLHPYFAVPEQDKSAIRWDFEGGEQIRSETEKWSNDGTAILDMPADRILRVFIPGIGNLQIETSSDFQKLWIWSLPGKDFVCIEPVMEHPGGITKAPTIIPAKQIYMSSMRISLQEQSY